MRTPLLLTAVALALTACAKAEPPPATTAPPAETGAIRGATAEPKTPLSQKTFGASITETTSTPLATLLGDPGKYGGKTVRTEGVVTAVCKSMGCWMEIGDDTGKLHVRMAGHAFFVPKTSGGHHAIVQGKVVAPEELACGDGCREHADEPAPTASVELEATGVAFVD